MFSEPIIALSTPPMQAALALIRMSGEECHRIIENLTGRTFTIRQATYCKIYDQGEIIDDVVVTLWQKPASYTGEEMVEICSHGNMLIVNRIMQLGMKLGARQARPGEFTQRAFLNGKMDLTQAEAVADLIHAQSERTLRAARRIQNGELGQLLLGCREELLQLLAHVEAYIDFPEEDIKPEVGEELTQKMTGLHTRLKLLLKTAEEGRRLREGLRVVLVGEPNAGKSSLFNALLRQERAIVSHLPGTTRDTVEESICIEGIEVRLIDTAGVRDKPDTIEQLGIERTHGALQEADLILYLIDGTLGSHQPIKIPSNKLKIVCVTKSDLPQTYEGEGIRISTLSKMGLDQVRQKMISLLQLKEGSDSQEIVVMNARHETLLDQAVRSLERAIELSQQSAPVELISSDLRQTLEALGEIIGQVTNEDMLDKLFASFCIGK